MDGFRKAIVPTELKVEAAIDVAQMASEVVPDILIELRVEVA